MKKLVLFAVLILSGVSCEVRSFGAGDFRIPDLRVVLSGAVAIAAGISGTTGAIISYYFTKKHYKKIMEKEIEKCVEKRLEEERLEAQEMKC